jgi:hypothetical protein
MHALECKLNKTQNLYEWQGTAVPPIEDDLILFNPELYAFIWA